MEQVEEFTPAKRATRYPYDEWLVGGSKIARITAGSDFFGTPASVAASINAYARSHGFVAVAYPARERPGGPFNRVELWGDPARQISEGLPEEIVEKLRRARRNPAPSLLPASMKP
ncbi:MAG TPA: hypothetical protein VGM91_05665 [Conexibacter sp.]|jgi:hypothetical protein